MIYDIEHNFPQKSQQKYIRKIYLGLLTETDEVLLRLIKTANIYVFKMATPKGVNPCSNMGGDNIGEKYTSRLRDVFNCAARSAVPR